ncbi:MAG: hypothetical protein IT262_01735 [Saprospiraceae bacterium]|nr:hypothetical protein [Saprospiraceae bacterium]
MQIFAPMNRITNLLLAGIAIAFGIYIVIRAWVMPITVDECSTAVSHVPRAVVDLLFLQTDANPNNHILNTLLIKGLTGLFGWHPFVVRIPALLGAFIYAWAGLQLSRKISAHAWIGVFAYTMLLFQPYLLEFFSLARGYALGLGLMLAAIWQAWRFLKEARWQNLHWSVVWAGLAVYANFTQVLFFIPFIGLLLWSAWQTAGSFSNFLIKTKYALLTLGIWAGLLAIPLKKLSQHSEVQHWNPLATLFGSAEKSIRIATYHNPLVSNDTAHVLTLLAILFTIGVCHFAVKKWFEQQLKIANDPLLFTVLLLFGILSTNVLVVELTHTPYLEPRLALLYWPIFALSLAATAAWLYQKAAKWAWIFMLPLGFLAAMNIRKSVNLREATEWWHDQYTYAVLDYIKSVQQVENHPEPYTFDTHGVMQNSYIFHLDLDPRGFNRIVKPITWHPDRPPTEDYEFYYAISENEATPILNTYDMVWKNPNCDMVLLRRKKK